MTISPRCLLFLSFALFLTGCPSGGTTPSGTAEKSGTAGDVSAQRCAGNLKNAFSSLDPQRLEIDADIESTVNVLNDWLTSCAVLSDLSTEDQKFLQKFLTPEEFRLLQGQRFASRDIGQIRTNILLREMAEAATAEAETELEKVVRLFEYVTRNVFLQPDNQKIPLTLYEVVLFGRATAQHQAWAFAELLHQLKIDSIILTPKGPASQKEWIFAVCLDDGNYLFDFSLQTPVPSLSDEQLWPIVQPATLEQAIENPSLLDALRERGSQVPSSDQLKSPAVWIPSESSYWSPRMQALNSTLAGKPFMVADHLLDGDHGQGILSRIDDAGDYWNLADIKPWPFPAEQLQGYWSIESNSSQSQILDGRKLPFYAPIDIRVDERTNKPVIQRSSNQQWQSRLAQLRGSYEWAISTYGRLRLGSHSAKSIFQGEADSDEFKDFLRREEAAAEDAHFWVGVSQMELGQFSVAEGTLRDYLTGYPDSRWTDSVRMMLATIELKNDDRADAAEQLIEIPKNSLMRPAADFIRSRLGPAGEQASSKEPDETKQTDSP